MKLTIHPRNAAERSLGQVVYLELGRYAALLEEVRISRYREGRPTCAVTLRLRDGRTFTLTSDDPDAARAERRAIDRAARALRRAVAEAAPTSPRRPLSRSA